MGIPRNIELFDRIAAITLVRLYEAFPNRIDLDGLQIGAEAAHDAKDDEEQFAIIASTGSDTISFLVEHGFVAFKEEGRTSQDSNFPGARLTLRGLNLLGNVPSIVNEAIDKRPYAELLKDAVRDGAKSTVSDLVQSLFKSALSGLVAGTLGG